ncbi:hypothetical protein H2200_006155 [Cladophialophora chaetospira]|uniref:Uncharacterized protein n=1 Tax=Cladophialophora chaetospira TaxID=386627 RepID=A0AA39CIT8_9EURO|nr:hypothetical protein H2200_006155 [Cladophialophora chaetospira]
MPLNPLSDRQSTVAYAIDLLRAHQIRRENVFLHEQLRNCLKEVAGLRDEVRTLKTNAAVGVNDEIKDLRGSIKTNHGTTQKALVLAEDHELRLKEQSQRLESLQQSCKAKESELFNVKMASTKEQENQHAKTVVLENQIQSLQADCQKRNFDQQQQIQSIHGAFESLQTALDVKADISAIDSLENRLEALRARPPAPKELLPPVSRVSESIEVVDSQQQDDADETDTLPLPPKRPGTRGGPCETVPEDLDLDANAHTISCAGHHKHILEQYESLDMLPPSAAQATQLARVKTLRQRRFEEWTTYYNQGHKLMENLPSSFEETVVHNFVEGIFKPTHKKQCRQWLDSNGWTWANITAFGDSFSQVVANKAREAFIGTSNHVEPPRLIKDLLAPPGLAENVDNGKKKKESRKSKAPRDPINEPVRRSQRLIEKDSQNKDLHETPFQPVGIARLGNIVPARAKVKQKEVAVVDDLADDLTSLKQTRSRIAEKKHVRAPQRKEADKGISDSRRVAKSHLAASWAQVAAAPSSRKRNPEPVEDEPLPKRSKSNKQNPGNSKLAKRNLVSAKRPATNSTPESSDDGSIWLTEARPGHPALVNGEIPSSRRRPAKYSAYSAQHNKDRKKPRLPLPPPPEIPITDTTEEE